MLAYRDIADTQAMIDAAATFREAVVVGGGLLGLEAANGLAKRGMTGPYESIIGVKIEPVIRRFPRLRVQIHQKPRAGEEGWRD